MITNERKMIFAKYVLILLATFFSLIGFSQSSSSWEIVEAKQVGLLDSMDDDGWFYGKQVWMATAKSSSDVQVPVTYLLNERTGSKTLLTDDEHFGKAETLLKQSKLNPENAKSEIEKAITLSSK